MRDDDFLGKGACFTCPSDQPIMCVAGRGSARKLAQITPTGILYSSRVKDMADLAADDEAAELEAAAQVESGC